MAGLLGVGLPYVGQGLENGEKGLAFKVLGMFSNASRIELGRQDRLFRWVWAAKSQRQVCR